MLVLCSDDDHAKEESAQCEELVLVMSGAAMFAAEILMFGLYGWFTGGDDTMHHVYWIMDAACRYLGICMHYACTENRFM